MWERVWKRECRGRVWKRESVGGESMWERKGENVWERVCVGDSV